MQVTYLNLNDLDQIIRKYEEKHGVSSVEMLKDQSVRSRIGEDELLKWEAYVMQRRRLLDHNEQVHRGYLQSRRGKTQKKTAVVPYDPAKYAA